LTFWLASTGKIALALPGGTELALGAISRAAMAIAGFEKPKPPACGQARGSVSNSSD
jgi:hypothetical protein